MAEVVELRVERGINELLQLERIGLFSPEETRRIVKKRKMFEYRLQKCNKSKEEYLRYISYEKGLLRLIGIRRRKSGLSQKLKEVDQTIGSRISGLFRGALFTCRNSQSDVQLWLSYIDFCRSMGWRGNVGSLYTRMLQVHSRKDYLWVAAAKFEFEENSAANTSRMLMQRGLQFIQDSRLLWQEYFRFELMYADKIRRRRQELMETDGMTGDEDEVNNDAILSGKIALVVYDSCVQKVQDASLAASLLDILSDFDRDWRQPLELHILDDMMVRFNSYEETWDMRAKYCMTGGMNSSGGKSSNSTRLKEAQDVYSDGLRQVPSEKMWTFYIKFMLEILLKTTKRNRRDIILSQILVLMQTAFDADLLSVDMFKEWLLIHKTLSEESQNEKETHQKRMKQLTQVATEKWTGNCEVWSFCLEIIRESQVLTPAELQSLYKRGIERVSLQIQSDHLKGSSEEDLSHLKKLIMDRSELSLKLTGPQEMLDVLYEACVGSVIPVHMTPGRLLSAFFKPLLLESCMRHSDLDSCFNYYLRIRDSHPVVKEVFERMASLLLKSCSDGPESGSKGEKRLDGVYEDWISHFGSEDAKVWLDYIQLQMRRGRADVVSLLYFRATKSLKVESVTHSSFIQQFPLIHATL